MSRLPLVGTIDFSALNFGCSGHSIHDTTPNVYYSTTTTVKNVVFLRRVSFEFSEHTEHLFMPPTNAFSSMNRPMPNAYIGGRLYLQTKILWT